MSGAPIVIYERRCELCVRWVRRWQARTGARVRYLPREVPLLPRLLGVSPRASKRAVQLVEPNGDVYEGAEAVFRALGRAPGMRLISRVWRLPGLRAIAGWVYRRVARNRSLAAKVDRLLFGKSTRPPQSARLRVVFTRALGLVWLASFTSLGAQVLGLYGRRGILPVSELLERADAVLGKRARREYPSVFWLDASDRSLVRACRLGQALSIALILGIAPRPVLFALWALHLSFVSVGRDFLSFQWDILLLETTMHALVVAPPGLVARRDVEPPWFAVLLMRWLAARFYVEAGIAKLRSGDETWKTRTACSYHYETQPLPTPIGYYAHHLPRSVHRAATSAALGIECLAPFLVLAPRRPRRLGFALLAGLQLVIAATGNYGFFNPLSIALSLWFLDDEALFRRTTPSRRTGALARVPIAAGAAALFGAGLATHQLRYGERVPPRALLRLARIGSDLRSMTAYGLFASMTVQRLEIAIEGSDDGEHWFEYEFRYKPGEPGSKPRWVAPHMPRLDWQMWFAALGPPPGWFSHLLRRLLEGSPDVLRLFRRTPFGGRAPRYVRAVLYDQRMTDLETRKRTGEYWKRTELGLYFPAVTLEKRVRDTAPSRAPRP